MFVFTFFQTIPNLATTRTVYRLPPGVSSHSPDALEAPDSGKGKASIKVPNLHVTSACCLLVLPCAQLQALLYM